MCVLALGVNTGCMPSICGNVRAAFEFPLPSVCGNVHVALEFPVGPLRLQ